ncbi:Bug family tripartite tricarboxylate transporter substrate binding protein [Hydrogenophaga sp. OTU3427]|uniref:Bug family tripartite tricarboxylate transporter substrate binding protein n=1 Tax=Hydrogenophaga sp. OTU3427 TaxID=3043856 RepID=UPI00313E0D9B
MTSIHRSPSLRRAFLAAACALPFAAALPAQAQAWPGKRPITLVVGFPAGGSADMIARTIAEPMAKKLGTPVVIENISGAAGTIAGQKVVNAAPDGHTLFMASGSEIVIAGLFNPAVKYQGERDFTAIGTIGDVPLVLVASPASGLKNLQDVLNRAKKDGGGLSYASSGVGTVLHVAGELLNQKAGTQITHVPYRGAAQMAVDIGGGNLELAFFMTPTAIPHIESGKMVALGVTTAGRSRAAPQIAPLGDTPALKGFDVSLWNGLFGPAKMPPAVVARLNQVLNEVLREPEVWQKLQKAGVETQGGTPQALSQRVRDEVVRVKAVAPTTMKSSS